MKYHLFRMKSLTLIILLSLVFSGINAQHWKFLRHELVGSIGSSNFFGELGGANDIGSSGIKGFKDLDFKLTRPALSAGYRFYINPKFAVKGTLTYGRLNGDDAQTTERFRQNRNLHFRSPLIELSAQFEYYPLNEYFGHLYRTNGVVGKKVNHFSPYLFVGVGGFWFNPKAEYNGDWVALQPLQTENVAYKRIALSLPFGVGCKYAISKQLSIGIEMGLRYTTTDYIDDVSTVYVDKSSADAQTQYLANPTLNSIPSFTDGSYVYNPTAVGNQRGDSKNKDAFLLTMVTVNYKILRGRNNLPKF
jgi:hypothetical protein